MLAFSSCKEIFPLTLLVGALLTLIVTAIASARAAAQAKVRVRSKR
jgi:hypothetical protein